MIIAIDFDGTIVEDAFPGIGRIKPGAVEAIKQFRQDGHFLILWTCRRGKRLAEAAQFLGENGLHFDAYNESCPSNVDKYSGEDTRKVFADMYIDDRGFGELPDWEEIARRVREIWPCYVDKILREGYL